MTTFEQEKFTILKDTREKEGWTFGNSKFVESVVDQCLPTGDYTAKGIEDIFIVERKASISEFAGNSTQVRFFDELNRMREFKYRYLVLEFDMQAILDWPRKCGLPAWKISQIKVSPQFIMRVVSQIQVEFMIPVLFCGCKYNAEYTTLNLMRRVCEEKRRIQAAN